MIHMASKSIALLVVGLIVGGALGIFGLDYVEIPGLGGGYRSLYEGLQQIELGCGILSASRAQEAHRYREAFGSSSTAIAGSSN